MEFLTSYGLYIGILAMIVGVGVMTYPVWSSQERQWVRVTVSSIGAITVLFGFFVALGAVTTQDLSEPAPEIVDTIEGSSAPDFEFDLVGDNPRTTTLSDYEGDVILINFWATWCAPCVHEMPALSQLQEAYADELTVLCISDETEDDIYDFLDGFEPLVQPIGVLTEEVSNIPAEYTMMQQIRPVSYVVDREGVIREVIRGARNYQQFEAKVRPYL